MERKKEAYDYLKEAIVSNELPPGCPIKELEISEKLKMSRTPIREALRMLEADGLVASYPFRGVFVTEVTPYDIDEIYELRILLEEWALRKSIMRITDDELDEVERLFSTAKDWDVIHSTDAKFHGLFIEKSGSRRVKSILDTFNGQLERYKRLGRQTPNRMKKSQDEHISIIKAIRERDVEKSCDMLRKHLRSVKLDTIEAAHSTAITGSFLK